MARTKREIEVAALRHRDKRRNIPTAELEAVMEDADKRPRPVRYPRNTDLDPQLVWRGKDDQDWSDLIVQAPPLYIQEKVHPKVLVDDLLRQSRERRAETNPPMPDLFADFNGLPDKEAVTEFYRHDANWSNRMILGDSLSVMASLAEREGLRGKVQCIYLDPPYGIRFNSNFQWSTTSRDVKDGNKDHITREPEQVKAFRDTWRDGIHSYLTYLRDRLTVARDLLADSGSIFMQIGDENVHRVRAVMDEVFGQENFIAQISFLKTTSATNEFLSSVCDSILWFARKRKNTKYRQLYRVKLIGGAGAGHYGSLLLPDGTRRPATPNEREGKEEVPQGAIFFTADQLQSAGMGRDKGEGAASWFRVAFEGREFTPTAQSRWKTNEPGMDRLLKSGRVLGQTTALRYLRKIDDFSAFSVNNVWTDVGGAAEKRYVVETAPRIVERCLLMATDPGDLVLDPTCGAGTIAAVAEQWGRRWITIDTSRVALALARARIMGARYPYYLLADSPEGQKKEGEVTRTPPKNTLTHGDIRQGFVYERVPHITLKSIANNAEIDVVWERWRETLEPLRTQLNAALGRGGPSFETAASRPPHDEGGLAARADASLGAPHAEERPKGASRSTRGGDATWDEWEIPREPGATWPADAKTLHAEWWEARIARQKEIDASIAAKAEFEYLYDKPYADTARIRVAGPFTVESLSPHRVLAVDADDSLIDTLDLAEDGGAEWGGADFAEMVLENLRTAGVQQAHKEDRIAFTSLVPWPGEFVCAEGRYLEGDQEARSAGGATGKEPIERRAAIFIGPEFGTVSRPDLVAAAREAADARFDVVIACAFNFDAHSSEFERLGRIPILKARMNADLHMAGELKSTGSGNLFVVFGEPDLEIEPAGDGQIRVKINGVDVFHPQTGEVVSGGPESIALWFIDTDYVAGLARPRPLDYCCCGHQPYSQQKRAAEAALSVCARRGSGVRHKSRGNRPLAHGGGRRHHLRLTGAGLIHCVSSICRSPALCSSRL
jgi:adenine-specific DNA-methyltransferase